MGNIMAFTAPGEFGHEPFRVRYAVTILALRHGLMLPFVTEGAVECAMLGLTAAQLVVRRLMTAAAVLVEHIVPVSHFCRHVGLVAFLAVRRGQMFPVRRMALGAFRFFAMHIVTIGTEELRVFTRVGLELLDLSVMAGQTGRCHVTGEGNIEGCMGVGVAIEAPFQLKMGETLMTDAALGDIVWGSRTMTRMAVGTVDFLVSRTSSGDIRRLFRMALDAVCLGQGRRLPNTVRLPWERKSHGHSAYQQQDSQSIQLPISFHVPSFDSIDLSNGGPAPPRTGKKAAIFMMGHSPTPVPTPPETRATQRYCVFTGPGDRGFPFEHLPEPWNDPVFEFREHHILISLQKYEVKM